MSDIRDATLKVASLLYDLPRLAVTALGNLRFDPHCAIPWFPAHQTQFVSYYPEKWHNVDNGFTV